MKKGMIVLLVLLVSMSVNAQLMHNTWKGSIKGDSPQEVTLNLASTHLGCMPLMAL